MPSPPPTNQKESQTESPNNRPGSGGWVIGDVIKADSAELMRSGPGSPNVFRKHSRTETVNGDKLPDGENRSPSRVGQFSAIHETFQGRAAAVRNFEFEALACRQNLVSGMAFLMA